MPWETRGERRYFYRSRWVGGRSVRRYIGRGPAGELAERLDQEARLRRAAEAEALRVEQARLEPPEGALRALDAACSLLIEATLTAAGFHRPNYGAWRRRRRARTTP